MGGEGGSETEPEIKQIEIIVVKYQNIPSMSIIETSRAFHCSLQTVCVIVGFTEGELVSL